jgi:endonuclease/exonuclease/phosphatase family metal-dependent hydrolase
MKTAFLLATALLACMYAGAQSRADLTLMSFNIRFDNPGDGDNRWDKRRDDVAQTMLFHQAQVCGLQEALHSQIQDLLQRMPGYAFVGVGRDDGQLKGEFSPILYDTRRLQLLDSGTFWLSDTPEKVSKGWDAALPRVATWAKLRDKTVRKVFFVVNTHFDHIGQEARKNSATLIVQRVQQLAGSSRAFIMGDFNARPEEAPITVLLQAYRDCKALSQMPHFGPEATFNGFGPKEQEGMRIDYIFCNDPSVKVLQHATLSGTWGGRFASDHHAVMARVR